MLTMQALTKGEITVLGGQQTRPNIHIEDIADLYVFLLENPNIQGIFNAGFENLSILTIAEIISKDRSKNNYKPSNDPRSYRVDSWKLLKTGFKPSKCVSDAIEEIILSFKNGDIHDKDECYNLKWMQKHRLDAI